MVALRTPAQVPPREPDGFQTDLANAEAFRETLLWLGYRLAHAPLPRVSAKGRALVCLDLDAGSGVLADEIDGDLGGAHGYLHYSS